ncbi:MAG: DUF2188 domain-containing protein [Bacteroidota bacterium]|nr:DUF2188 domain-containing protein [Bacteroidota bacterium]
MTNKEIADGLLKREGASKASRVYDTKEESVKRTGSLSKSGHDVIIHKRDGSIEKWKSSKR